MGCCGGARFWLSGQRMPFARCRSASNRLILPKAANESSIIYARNRFRITKLLLTIEDCWCGSTPTGLALLGDS